MQKEILFVLGSSSWLSWIKPMLSNLESTVDLIADESQDLQHRQLILSKIKNHSAKKIVFLSHHETLLRDADLAEELSATTNKLCFFQPREVAQLAYDKRGMSQFSESILDLNFINELNDHEIRHYLENKQFVIAKKNHLTEGLGLRILRSTGEYEDFISSSSFDKTNTIFQPFVEGIEFSVNLTIIKNKIFCFEPVFKSLNSSSQSWAHPSKRIRNCPELKGDAKFTEIILKLSEQYVRHLGAQVLVELEFIIDANGKIWFLEINPRLAATVRMVSLVSKFNVFEGLVKLLDESQNSDEVPMTERVPTFKFSQEFPLSSNEQSALKVSPFKYPEFSFTSRATVTGRNPQELGENVKILKEFLQNESKKFNH